MPTATYLVKGMTCGHCAGAVRSEVGAISGVADVQVDLSTGQVSVVSTQPLHLPDVREAVEEAGYELVTDPGTPR